MIQQQQQQDVPTWRTGSMSDWKLKTASKDYSVHRYVFAFGPRRSAFMMKQFLQTEWVKEESGTDLNFLPARAQAPEIIHLLLEYVYEGTLSLTGEMAIPLMTVAQYLMIPTLTQHIMTYLADVSTVCNLCLVLSDALEFRQELCLPVLYDRLAQQFVFEREMAALAFGGTEKEEKEEKDEKEEKNEVKDTIKQRKRKRRKVDIRKLTEQQQQHPQPESTKWRCESQENKIATHLTGAALLSVPLYVLPVHVMAGILASDHLTVDCEDQVYQYISAVQPLLLLAENDSALLWGSCRFAYLSGVILQQLIRSQATSSITNVPLTMLLSGLEIRLGGHAGLIAARQRSFVKKWVRAAQKETESLPHQYAIGTEVDAWCYRLRKWFVATVCAGKGQEQITIHYNNWDTTYNISLPRDSPLIAPQYTHTTHQNYNRLGWPSTPAAPIPPPPLTLGPAAMIEDSEEEDDEETETEGGEIV